MICGGLRSLRDVSMSLSSDGTAWRFRVSMIWGQVGLVHENHEPRTTGTGKSRRAWCKTYACEGVDDLESEMTQPAKVQEPSMEGILASIRRIIADDEAKPPPGADKPAAAAPPPAPVKPEKPATASRMLRPPRPPVMNDIPPSKIASSAKPAAPRRLRHRHRPRATSEDDMDAPAEWPGRDDDRGRSAPATARRRGAGADRRHGGGGRAAAVFVPEGRPRGRSGVCGGGGAENDAAAAGL